MSNIEDLNKIKGAVQHNLDREPKLIVYQNLEDAGRIKEQLNLRKKPIEGDYYYIGNDESEVWIFRSVTSCFGYRPGRIKVSKNIDFEGDIRYFLQGLKSCHEVEIV